MSWGKLYKLIPHEPVDFDLSTSSSPGDQTEEEVTETLDEFIPLMQFDGTIVPTYVPLKRQTGGVISSKDFPPA